ncbi:hypothetical protein OTERR_18070 [Oryzomicrobium terrae]|uniref:Beta-ketoacyl synthase N-terminal domain-containing protein n=1 Tax=Oryzomicrobium terrae TaxID=1735038 RepID=A0A5C1E8T0_9RHOO|nr:hypothetical protein [Oryzomicrobium terrae]QEL65283.1 hypothetical protein OTERR_18070 [Oryzomicrobium terrae]
MSAHPPAPRHRLWQITGRSCGLPEDWHARLVARLGQRPRRLGTWTELALYGALDCMADVAARGGVGSADSTANPPIGTPSSPSALLCAQLYAPLPPAARLRVSSVRGSAAAIGAGLDQFAEGWVLPFTFMQTLPSQLLAALARALGWQGDGSFVASADPLQSLALACAGAPAAGVLWGRVDELPEPNSLWLRLEALSGAEGAASAGKGREGGGVEGGVEDIAAACAVPLPAVCTFRPLRATDLANPALALLRWGPAGLEGGFSD